MCYMPEYKVCYLGIGNWSQTGPWSPYPLQNRCRYIWMAQDLLILCQWFLLGDRLMYTGSHTSNGCGTAPPERLIVASNWQIPSRDGKDERVHSESARGVSSKGRKGFPSISQLVRRRRQNIFVFTRQSCRRLPLSFCVILTHFALNTVRFEMKNK